MSDESQSQSPLDAKLQSLEKMKSLHVSKGKEIVSAYGGKMYNADIMSILVLNRSIALIGGFCTLIRNKNFICAASILRIQLDTLIRYHAMWLVKNPHEFIAEFLNGQQLNRLRDENGEKMTDRYLVELISKEHPWIKNVYKETCGYIHLSDKHYFNALTSADGNGGIRLSINECDTAIQDEHRIEAVSAFTHLTKLIFEKIDGYIYTKANPELVKKMKEKMMDNVTEERYVFYRIASGDFQWSKQLTEISGQQTDPGVRASVQRDAIIAYARPFTRTQGKFSKNYRLEDAEVPQSILSIHNEIMKWRSKIIAHGDIDLKDPQLHCWTNSKQPTFPILFHSPGPMPSLQDISRACDAAFDLAMQKTIAMEKQFAKDLGLNP